MKSIKLAVVGSRGLNTTGAKAKVFTYLDSCLRKAKKDGLRLIIVSGGARGIDTFAKDFAKARGLIPITIDAAWQDENGKTNRAAGYERNEIIWEIADCGIAFWDRVSPGTKHSFEIAARLNKNLVIVEADELPW